MVPFDARSDPTDMTTLLLVGTSGIVAALTTWLVRRYAVTAALLDIPNERSSHSVPTPRGGGIGIFVGMLIGCWGATAMGWLELRLLAALVVGGALVAAVGFVDDHRHVQARIRALVHFVAAILALMLIGGLPAVRFGDGYLALGTAGWVIGAVGIVWSINLYNFMDGIDGIAASEAILVCGIGGG